MTRAEAVRDRLHPFGPGVKVWVLEIEGYRVMENKIPGTITGGPGEWKHGRTWFVEFLARPHAWIDEDRLTRRWE